MSRTKNKMVIVMRKDLNMTKGKFVAQGSHASLGLVLNIQRESSLEHAAILEGWLSESFIKICVCVNSEEELLHIYRQSKEMNLPSKLITDKGWTMFNGVPTNTCISILGPSEKVDLITGHLKLL